MNKPYPLWTASFGLGAASGFEKRLAWSWRKRSWGSSSALMQKLGFSKATFRSSHVSINTNLNYPCFAICPWNLWVQLLVSRFKKSCCFISSIFALTGGLARAERFRKICFFHFSICSKNLSQCPKKHASIFLIPRLCPTFPPFLLSLSGAFSTDPLLFRMEMVSFPERSCLKTNRLSAGFWRSWRLDTFF